MDIEKYSRISTLLSELFFALVLALVVAPVSAAGTGAGPVAVSEGAGAACARIRASATGPGATGAPAPTLQQLRNASYRGIDGAPAHITLDQGHWEGQPAVAGSASIPRVDLLGDLHVTGDLDRDGGQEAATIVVFNFGGTGVFHYLAVLRGGADAPVNIATRLIGDRIQVIDACIDRRSVVLDLVRAGPEDPSCCPGEVASLAFELAGDRLAPPRELGKPVRLSTGIIGSGNWQLEQWTSGEAAPPGITMSRSGDSLRGRAACNSYSAPLRKGDRPDAIRIGPAITTRMACEPQTMQAEHRFLDQLQRVTRFRFHAGKLVLDFGAGTQFGSMFFVRQH